MAKADGAAKESKLAIAAAAADAAGSPRRRRRGREGDETKLSLLSAPPEVMSVIMLFLDGPTLAQASCVSVVSVKRWTTALSRWVLCMHSSCGYFTGVHVCILRGAARVWTS